MPPEENNTSIPENQEPESNPSISGTPPETPPTNQPPTSPTEQPSRYADILEATLKEQQRTIQQLQNQINAPRTEEAPTLTEEEARQLFYNNPLQVLDDRDKKLMQALQRTIDPLIEFTKSMRGDGTPYGKLKNQFRSDPRFSAALNDPAVDQAIDRLMDKAELSEANMMQAVVSAVGMKNMGLLGMVGINQPATPPTPPPTNTPTSNTVIPAHLRPTAPASPANPNKKPELRELTELEMRICRERGMTKEDYLAWLDVPDTDVPTSKIGLAK